MPTSTVIPRYVNPPKQAGWKASIKDGDNEYWSFDPKFIPINTFSPGQEVTFDWLPETAKDGRVFNTIKRVHNPHSQGAHPGPAPAPKLNGTLTDKDILLSSIGLVKSYIEAGKIDLSKSSLRGALIASRDTIRDVFGSNQHADDMNDEIPNWQ